MPKSLAEQLNDARLLAAGMKQHAAELAPIGINADDIAALEAKFEKTSALNSKQEQLKAELKYCTAELTDECKAMTDFVSAMRKRVKLVLPQTEWKAFGIAATR